MANGDSGDTSSQLFGGQSVGDIAPSGNIPSVPDSSTSQAPPTSQTPPNQTDEGKVIQDQIKQDELLRNQILEAHQKTTAEFNKSLEMRDQAVDRLRETLKLPVDGDVPQKIDFNSATQQQHNAATQVNTTWPAIVGVGMAVAGMLGKHHGGIGSQFFLGSFLQSYGKGMQEAKKQQREDWWKQVEYEHQVMSERLANYRAALTDKRLNTQQALELFKTYADIYGDQKKSLDAERGDLNAINRQMSQDRLAMDRYLKEARNTLHATDHLMGSSEGKQWEDEAYARWAASHDGHLPMTEQQQAEARQKYGFATWSSEQGEYKGTDSEGKPRMVPKYPKTSSWQQGDHLFARPPHEPGTGGSSDEGTGEDSNQKENYEKSIAPSSLDQYFGGGN
jgi:hypothetical protein